MEIITSAILTVAGLIMLCLGGNWLVSGGIVVAKKLRLSNFVIGMTIVAYGTSTPELATSIAASGQHGLIILGNVVGSNIANIGMVVAITAIFVPLVVDRSILRKEILIIIGVSLLLVLLSLDGSISEFDGILLLFGLGLFTFYTYKNAMKHRRETETKQEVKKEKEKNRFSLKPIGLIVLGIALLYIGAILTVDNAVILAEEFGLSEKIIGLTVIAIGTSLPELITSLIAIRKGHTNIGIGTIIGSNIYNILMILGIGAVLGSIMISSDVYVDYIIMMAFTVSLLIVLKTGLVSRGMGICLIMGYIGYLGYMFFK